MITGFGFSDLRCPACGKVGIDTENADDLEVFDGCVTGWIDWYCVSCGASGEISFEAVLENATVYENNRAAYNIRDGKEVME